MRTFMLALALVCVAGIQNAFSQLPLRYEKNIAPTYQEAISMYRTLASKYPMSRLIVSGSTDVGKPLHLFVISKSGEFDPAKIRKSGKLVIFINNAIHAGECDGVDASLKISEEILRNPGKYATLLDHCVIAIIPVYNIGGYLNRSPYNRANQNGPAEEGFRGNARNLDLNRDMIKTDSENARSLSLIFHRWNPDILVDTHVSDGADYPYVMTLIPSLHSRLQPSMATFLDSIMLPALYADMRSAGTEMIPYVESRGDNPATGIEGFDDLPHYVSGYATLFNTYAFVTEAHMLKPYKDRVVATYNFLQAIFRFAAGHHHQIRDTRKQAVQEVIKRDSFVLAWEPDTSRYDEIMFRGYTARYKPSKVSGLPRLYYDHSSPWEKKIRYYNYFKPSMVVKKPEYYIIPQAWKEVTERLAANGIQFTRLEKDTSLTVDVYYIQSYRTGSAPYNGRYMHTRVTTRSERQTIPFYKGDYLVKTNQSGNNYILQVLEPSGPDSFFAWGFFDSVLSRKEYFSSYVFEDTAEKLLQQSPELQKQLDERRAQDSLFRNNAYMQLNFIYEHSPWAEKTYNRYPVFRLN